MSGALDGVRVLDFGQYLAAPLLGVLLAEQGAEVVQVNPPEGPMWDHPAWKVFQRGKTRLDLDLHDETQRARARELARGADVLIEGFRPGVMDRLGLSADVLRADNPGLVYVSLPGFGREDPRRGLAGWEGVVHTAAGIFERPFGRRPVVHPVNAASVLAASWAATAVGAALLAKQRDGFGQRVEVPLFDAALAAQEFQALFFDKPPPVWTTLAWASTPFMGLYRCADGRWIYVHLGLAPQARHFVELLGERGWDDAPWAEHVDAEALASPGELHSIRQAAWVRQRLEHVFSQASAEQWEQRFGDAGLCAAVCRAEGEWLDHAQARETRQVVELDGLRQPGRAVRLDGEAPALVGVQPAGSPVWAPRPTPAGPEDGRPPLAGVRVLDLTQVIAGPTCGRTLAELGAEVLRIENPHFTGGFTQPFHLAFSAGKRTATLDLRTEAGLEAFVGLVAAYSPDVLVESSAPGSLARLGITPKRIEELAPGCVWVAVSAYDRDGPWGGWKGWEQTAQAVTGTQHRYGADGIPDTLAIPANDLGTGVLAAFGAVTALVRRARTRRGGRVDASLVRTSLWLQALALVEHQRGIPVPSGPTALGARALARAYKTRDGWLWVEGQPHDWPGLELVDGLEGIAELPNAQREAELEDRMARLPTREWARRFQGSGRQSGLAVMPRTTPLEAVRDPWLRARGQVQRHDYPGLGRVTTVRHPVRLSRTTLPDLEPARIPGSDTAAVLRQYQLSGVPAPAPIALHAGGSASALGRLGRTLSWGLRQLKWAGYRAWLERRIKGGA